jgi:aspartyl-tRNA(Asn)/glutamyl-tRNA(Gln) amidotransferase subunit A
MNDSSNPPLSIVAAAAQLRTGKSTALELVEQCLQRIERFEQQVHAWVVVDANGARRTAKELDVDAVQGNFRGPLHGIPLGIKDIVDVAGFPTFAGSTIRRGHVAQRDATIVARLRRAGAIILGKTVTTEFASFDPPPTLNPWNLERTPGGSSSGSAAAVSLGMCLGAIGSQTGGSITRPASYCGVAGCKPTYGRVPLTSIVPLAFHLDHPGPIAGTVSDLAILLGAIAGYDAEDPYSSAAPVPPLCDLRPPAKPPRLAWLQGFFMDGAQPAVRESLEAACQRLQDRGAVVEKVEIAADLTDVLARHRRVMAVEAAEYHRPWFPTRRAEYGPNLATLLDEGRKTTSLDYAEAVRRQPEFRQQALAAVEGFDALLLPATSDTAPATDTTGNPRFNSPWSYCGLPTVSFPCQVAADGLPLSLQLVGRPLDEGSLLAVAAWCERQIDFSARPSLASQAAR